MKSERNERKINSEGEKGREGEKRRKKKPTKQVSNQTQMELLSLTL